ncbi:MAG: hypothetical protein GY854_09135 [Deltaproteobacteria bacterium]|nr:hypothetical protein [Deltaproteobacteria bacterium]
MHRIHLEAIWFFGIVMLIASFGLGAENDLRVEWQDRDEHVLTSTEDALHFSRPPHPDAKVSEDPSRFRLRVFGAPSRPLVRVSLLSVDTETGRVRDRLELRSFAADKNGALVAPWIVLVTNMQDRSASEFAGFSLMARLGDRIEARARIGGATSGTWTIPVGQAESQGSPRRLRLHVVVLKQFAGGLPLAGGSSRGARAVMRHQVEVLGEVLAQCTIEPVVLTDASIDISDPPGACLLAVGERFGLPSAGGEVRLMVDGVRLGPWKIGSGYSPQETARLLSHHLSDAGFRVELSNNRKAPDHALATSDILVRRADGSLAEMSPWPDRPLSTDSRQSLEIGIVNLAGGINAYDENAASSGTLEERTLIKALSDTDDRTVDVFVVNHFSSRVGKQGESFIRAGESSLKNAVVIDLNALGRARQSYTLSHEIGHVLLDDLGHPDTRGDNRTWLLMHSNSSSAVGGPRRLTAKECERIHRVSADLLE